MINKRFIRVGDARLGGMDKLTEILVIHMITGRLATLRKKMQMIANASKAQQNSLHRKRSNEITPRSAPTHSS
jgi:serine/threonine-protein kinase ULK/ATG1